MRTTITIDRHLLEELKQRAAASGTTVSRLLENAARLLLAPRASEESEPEFELVTYGRGGQFTELNVDKSSKLLEMEDLERYGHETRPGDD